MEISEKPIPPVKPVVPTPGIGPRQEQPRQQPDKNPNQKTPQNPPHEDGKGENIDTYA